MKSIIKTGLATLLIATLPILGDKLNINDKIINPIIYKGNKVSKDCYQNPFIIEKRYFINEKKELEIYVGCNERWYKIDKDLRTNKPTLEELAKEELSNITDQIINYMKNKIFAK
ncbi:hypothetical protein J4468_04275 [Candidatus Woesearchaeota archaeon]|nr:hypothetical protein [Candidatus Woesearchaeota archaeon]